MKGLTPRHALIAATIAVGGLALANGAAAVPSLTSPPAGAVVDSLRPEYRWTDGSIPASAVRFEVHYTAAPGTPPVAQTPVVSGQSAYAATGTADLPQDQVVTWFVRSIAAGGGTASESPEKRSIRASPPPAVSGPSGLTNQAAPAYTWTRPATRTTSAWQLVAGGTTVREGTSDPGAEQAALAPLADGSYEFRVTQTVVNGVVPLGPSATAVVPLTIDTTPPGLLTITSAPPFPTTNGNPSFSWSGGEPGARLTWRVIGVGGGVIRTGDGAAGTAAVGPLGPGSYAFELRQQDAAGNAGDWRSQPFAVVAPPAPTAGVPTSRLRLPTRNAKALKPAAGTRVRSLRPTLRWSRKSRASLYNVQVFLVGNRNRLSKVLSTFPRSPRLRVPNRELRRGRCYVWRVWPYIGDKFTKRPLGVSNFCVTAARR